MPPEQPVQKVRALLQPRFLLLVYTGRTKMITQEKLKEIVQAFHKDEYRLSVDCDGDSHPFILCTNCSKWARDNFFPDGKIMGFHESENPTSQIAQRYGGHDFLLVKGRYIIDLWVRFIEMDDLAPIFLDLVGDRELVEKLYGDLKTWGEVK